MIRRLLLAALLLSGLTACDQVKQVSDTVGSATDKAGICVQALKLAGFTPNLSDPAQAARDAKKTSDDLAQLANQSPDATLTKALGDMSHKVGELTTGNLTPARVTDWASSKASTAAALTKACA